MGIIINYSSFFPANICFGVKIVTLEIWLNFQTAKLLYKEQMLHW